MIEMSEAGIGGQAGPEVGGDHPIGVVVVKNREVPQAVHGVMGALKAAGAKFREYQAHHSAKAVGLYDEASGTRVFSGNDPRAAALEATRKADVNREMAEMCERAIADLEAALAPRDEGPKPKPPPSPSALFRAGFDYGTAAKAYELTPEDKRDESGLAPPHDWAAAWAVVRAQIATQK